MWHLSAKSAHGRLKQEDQEFETRGDYIVRAWIWLINYNNLDLKKRSCTAKGHAVYNYRDPRPDLCPPSRQETSPDDF